MFAVIGKEEINFSRHHSACLFIEMAMKRLVLLKELK